MGKIYGSVSGEAKEIRKVLFSPTGTAQQYDKAYIGDANGAARLVFPPSGAPAPVGSMYLIQDGVSVNGELTGGWQGRAETLEQGGTATAPSIDLPYSSNPYGRFHLSSGTKSGIAETVNDIDLTSYNKIILYGKRGSNGTAKLCVINRLDNSIVTSIEIVDTLDNYELGISELSGSYEICVFVKSTSSGQGFVLPYNLWLE